MRFIGKRELTLAGAVAVPLWRSPCPASARPGRRRNEAPTPPSFPLRPSAGRGTGGAGPGCQAARRPRNRSKRRGQATAVTVPPMPCGGGRLSRSARRTVRMRARRMLHIVSITGSHGSSPIALRCGRQDPYGRTAPDSGSVRRCARVLTPVKYSSHEPKRRDGAGRAPRGTPTSGCCGAACRSWRTRPTSARWRWPAIAPSRSARPSTCAAPAGRRGG